MTNVKENNENDLEKMSFEPTKWFKISDKTQVIRDDYGEYVDFNIKEVDPVKYKDFFDNIETLSPSGDAKENILCYNSNGGKLVAYNELGEYYMGAHTSENIKQLEKAGYIQKSMGVPCSNGIYRFIDHVMQARWVLIKHAGDNEVAKRTERANLAKFKETQTELEEKSSAIDFSKIDKKNWMLMDGVEYVPANGDDNEPATISSNFDDQYNRERDMGTWSYNGGIIAFVDETGQLWMSPMSDSRLDECRAAGFTESRFGIPMSSTGGEFVDILIKSRWIVMKADAEKENDENLVEKQRREIAKIATEKLNGRKG